MSRRFSRLLAINEPASIPSHNPWHPLAAVDTEKRGGEPVFRGTRVPALALLDYLKEGYDLHTFLSYFGGVRRDDVEAILELSAGGIANELRAA